MSGGLGRRVPTDWKHVDRYPLRTLLADPAHPLAVPGPTEKSLGLPTYWKLWDQGEEGACEGFGNSAMKGITDSRQILRETGTKVTIRLAPFWLYGEAQAIDEWDDTPPGEGTSGRAACEVMRVQGHRRVRYGKAGPVEAKWGIDAYRWATSVDEIRAAIADNLAVALGVNWYSNFDNPVLVAKEPWIGRSWLGSIRGGHDVCLYRMSDRREAFMLMNSWGAAYPPVWIPYPVVTRLLVEDGEAAVITDR